MFTGRRNHLTTVDDVAASAHGNICFSNQALPNNLFRGVKPAVKIQLYHPSHAPQTNPTQTWFSEDLDPQS
jgi:hypothetical protein